MRADLHLHSSCSDGVMAPAQLARACLHAGLEWMAITDHDTFEGWRRLHGSPVPKPGLIQGVELSLSDMNGLHLLGYGRKVNTPLHAEVGRLAEKRQHRAAEMLERLASMHMPLSMTELQTRCQGTIGRPHIARAMVAAGYVSCMQEAFERYLGHGKPAYVAGERMSMREALALMAGSGFVPVLAHPYELKLPEEALTPLIEGWVSQGLRGIEVYHPSARRTGFAFLRGIAKRLQLLITGGSDFHQEHDRHTAIGSMCDDWADAGADIPALLEAIGEMPDV